MISVKTVVSFVEQDRNPRGGMIVATKRMERVFLLGAAFAAAVIPLLSQTSTKPKPSFDVVSIKPSAPDSTIRGGGVRGNRYTMNGRPLRGLLQTAYQNSFSGGSAGTVQIIGGPAWMDTDRYDIQATVDCSGGVVSREQLQLMIQSMLEDRFELKAHMETRELPIYNLVVDQDGPKFKASADQTPIITNTTVAPLLCSAASAAPPAGPPATPQITGRGGPTEQNFGRMSADRTVPRGVMGTMPTPTGRSIRASAVPLLNLVNLFRQQTGRPVIDKTDLKGLFDFSLQFRDEELPEPGGGISAAGRGPTGAPGIAVSPAAVLAAPSLFTAIQEQLRLRLESATGLVDVLVVDSVQKPREN
jgi:uncharacterized protein (TIGR03435 family)